MNSHKLLRRQVTSEIKKRRLVAFTLMLLTLLYLVVTITFGSSGLIRYLELRDKKVQLVQEIKEIEARNTRLKADTKLLKNDPFYVEKHAREDFGMAKPDEYVFKFEQ
jgi:cell division protein FtsB